jgi:hypothetical protein
MAQFQRRNPWDPRYSTPEYVYGEPPGRGTVTTKGLRRGTIDVTQPHRPVSNWAVPGYVLAEVPGRGAYDTRGLPRRWVDTKAPDDFMKPYPAARPAVRGSLSGTVFSKRTLSGSSLGSVSSYSARGRARRRPFAGDLGSYEGLGDTISNWVGADVVLFGVKFRVSRGSNYPVEKSKWPYIGRAGGVLGEGRGASVLVPKTKVPKELFKIIDDKLGAELQKLIKSDKSLAGDPRGLLLKAKQNLGLIGPSKSATAIMKMLGNMSLESYSKKWPPHLILGKLTEVNGIEVYGKNWTIDVEEVARGTGYKLTIYVVPNTSTLGKISNVIGKPFELVGGLITGYVDMVENGIEAAMDALAKLAEIACKAAQNDLVQLTGQVAATAKGGPAGGAAFQAGNAIIQKACSGGSAGPAVVQPKKSMLPWILAGGGVLLVVLAVSR